MLPPFIIEQIRKRESEEARREQPHLELPLEPLRRRPPPEPKDDEAPRGVIILEL
jgi:hypothetical protein